MTGRTVLSIGGGDREKFLDGLVTNHLPRPGEGAAYAALLTPQGKYIADFFLVARDDDILVDVASELAPSLAQRLGMYKLRADVTIAEAGLNVRRGTGAPPDGALPDPRHPALGWRLYGEAEGDDGTDWDALRVELMVPEAGAELTPESYILELGFERLNGVDFRKGCFVGQEVTARMKHKTELRKGLARLRLSEPAEPGTAITAEGKLAGTLHTTSGNRALAYLRYDRANGPMEAGAAEVALDSPEPATK